MYGAIVPAPMESAASTSTIASPVMAVVFRWTRTGLRRRPQARVEERVRDVGQHVGEEVHQRHEQDHTLCDGKVLFKNRRDGQTADALPREHGLDDDRVGHGVAKLGARRA